MELLLFTFKSKGKNHFVVKGCILKHFINVCVSITLRIIHPNCFVFVFCFCLNPIHVTFQKAIGGDK